MKVDNRKIIIHALFLLGLIIAPHTSNAHDLPLEGSLTARHFRTECFGPRDLPVNQPAFETAVKRQPTAGLLVGTSSTISLVDAYRRSLQSAMRLDYAIARSVSTVRGLLGGKWFADTLTATPAKCDKSEFWVVRPEKAAPPAPVVDEATNRYFVFNIQSQFKQQFIEDYLPYDLAIQDWRFGLFTSPAVVQAEVQSNEEMGSSISSVAAEHNVVAEFLERIESIECRVFSELSSGQGVADLARTFNDTRIRVSQNTIGTWASYISFVTARDNLEGVQPRFAQPQHVVITNKTGQRYCIPVALAKRWANDSVTNLSKTNAPSVAKGRTGAGLPVLSRLRNHILSALSNGLEVAGTSLISISKSLSIDQDHLIDTGDGRIAEKETSSLR